MDAKDILFVGLAIALVFYGTDAAAGRLRRADGAPGRGRFRDRIFRHARHRLVCNDDGGVQAPQDGPGEADSRAR